MLSFRRLQITSHRPMLVVFFAFLLLVGLGPLMIVNPQEGPPPSHEVFGAKRERPSLRKVRRFKAEAAAALRRFRPKLPPSQNQERLRANPQARATPDDPVFSWRAAGSVTPARSQGNCGSCYVFGPVAALEANWAMRHDKQMINASEQHVLNCISGDCEEGGLASEAMTYLVSQAPALKRRIGIKE
jgi:Papain family cysteine protease